MSPFASPVYMFCFTSYIYPAPDHFNRVVGGWTYTQEALDHISRNPNITDHELIAGEGNDEEKVWTKVNLRTTRLLVLFAWLGLFSSVTLAFTVFLVLQRKGK